MTATDGIDTALSFNIRRLSTWSICRSPHGHPFATDWQWYWQGINKKWYKYSEQPGLLSNNNNEKLERNYQKYLLDTDGRAIVSFTAGKSEYTLNFETMKQKNKCNVTKNVRRRPTFVSVDDVKEIIRCGPPKESVSPETLSWQALLEEAEDENKTVTMTITNNFGHITISIAKEETDS
uniref:Zinc finger CCCH-type antiviral protein 1-like n=1 Tax=Saccoglossus kowalevskii TaxID=10224 RepID=A0ABM0MEP5_SACKO|nr:PREDICTED: zinc finger CCCH-type antiviral protein 1-like [Saccoglossus kowalevskii]